MEGNNGGGGGIIVFLILVWVLTIIYTVTHGFTTF